MERKDYNIISEERSSTATLPAIMKKVYLWMAFALAITGLTAANVAGSQAMLQTLASGGMIWILFIAELGLVWYLSARIMDLSVTTATIMFIIYSALNGVTMSFIFLAYTATSISTVFFITAGTFGITALVGMFTKRDLSSMGGLLFMALIGIIIASIANMFIHSDGMNLFISYAGVLLFVGLTAYDSQKIKNMLMQTDGEGETAHKIALMGALSLYLDFINLFLYLLRIFGERRN